MPTARTLAQMHAPHSLFPLHPTHLSTRPTPHPTPHTPHPHPPTHPILQRSLYHVQGQVRGQELEKMQSRKQPLAHPHRPTRKRITHACTRITHMQAHARTCTHMHGHARTARACMYTSKQSWGSKTTGKGICLLKRLSTTEMAVDRKSLCILAETEPVSFKCVVDEAKRQGRVVAHAGTQSYLTCRYFFTYTCIRTQTHTQAYAHTYMHVCIDT